MFWWPGMEEAETLCEEGRHSEGRQKGKAEAEARRGQGREPEAIMKGQAGKTQGREGEEERGRT